MVQILPHGVQCYDVLIVDLSLINIPTISLFYSTVFSRDIWAHTAAALISVTHFAYRKGMARLS